MKSEEFDKNGFKAPILRLIFDTCLQRVAVLVLPAAERLPIGSLDVWSGLETGNVEGKVPKNTNKKFNKKTKKEMFGQILTI